MKIKRQKIGKTLGSNFLGKIFTKQKPSPRFKTARKGYPILYAHLRYGENGGNTDHTDFYTNTFGRGLRKIYLIYELAGSFFGYMLVGYFSVRNISRT